MLHASVLFACAVVIAKERALAQVFYNFEFRYIPINRLIHFSFPSE